MKRIVLLTAIALSVTACGRQSPVDASVVGHQSTISVPDVQTDIAAEIRANGQSDVKTQGLHSLTIAQLNSLEDRLESKCLDGVTQPECKQLDAVYAEWHARGWCAYDAQGHMKSNCTPQEIADDND